MWTNGTHPPQLIYKHPNKDTDNDKIFSILISLMTDNKRIQLL